MRNKKQEILLWRTEGKQASCILKQWEGSFKSKNQESHNAYLGLNRVCVLPCGIVHGLPGKPYKFASPIINCASPLSYRFHRRTHHEILYAGLCYQNIKSEEPQWWLPSRMKLPPKIRLCNKIRQPHKLRQDEAASWFQGALQNEAASHDKAASQDQAASQYGTASFIDPYDCVSHKTRFICYLRLTLT